MAFMNLGSVMLGKTSSRKKIKYNMSSFLTAYDYYHIHSKGSNALKLTGLPLTIA